MTTCHLESFDKEPQDKLRERSRPTLVSGIGPWYGYVQAKRIDMEGT
jgi:hypothetical protein